MLLTVLALFAVLGMIAAVSVPVIANITSVAHNRSVSDARRVGEEVVSELFARVRDQRVTTPNLPTAGFVAPAAAVTGTGWVMWDSTHSDFTTCATSANTCFYYSYKKDTSAAGATPRSMLAEVTVRNGCGLPDTCTYRRYQQTLTRRLITDYVMIANSDSGLYIEGQPTTAWTTSNVQAIAAGYWRNSTAATWTMADVSFENQEELFGLGQDLSTAIQAAAGSGSAAPKGAIRFMTQLVLADAGAYQIRAVSPDEAGRLRRTLRDSSPSFDVAVDTNLTSSAGTYSAVDTVTTTTANTKVLLDLVALNNLANKSTAAKTVQLQIKPPSGSTWIDVAAGNTVAMHATFDTAHRSGNWFYDGPIHINGSEWAACNRLDLFDNGESGVSDLVAAGKSGCTPTVQSLDRNGAVAATSFATAAPKILLPSTFTEQEAAATSGGAIVAYGAALRFNGVNFTPTNLSTGTVGSASTAPTNSVIWVKGNAELSGTADNATVLVDGDATITGDLYGNNLGVVVKGNLKVRGSNYKRTIQASLLAVGTAGLENPSPGAWTIGLPRLELFGSVAASTPFQNSDGNGAMLPQFKLPTPPWTPPYFPQATNAKWEQTSLTELPVTSGLTLAP